jgi:hypothetical protein
VLLQGVSGSPQVCASRLVHDSTDDSTDDSNSEGGGPCCPTSLARYMLMSQRVTIFLPSNFEIFQL